MSATLRLVTDERPKTAFEIAMERFRDRGAEAAPPLSEEAKAAIAEARQLYQAKVAERQILHQAALRKVTTREELDLLDEALRRDLERLAGDRDRKIAQIKGEAAP